MSSDEDERDIVARKKREDFKYSPSSEVKADAFDYKIRRALAAEECAFCVPPCTEFPNCKCGRQNVEVYKKYRLL